MCRCFGLPGTSGFIGEFLVLVGAFTKNYLVALLATIGVVLGAAYMLWLAKKVIFGEITNDKVKKLSDVNKSELALLSILAIITIALGFYPNLILDTVDISVNNLIYNYENGVPQIIALEIDKFSDFIKILISVSSIFVLTTTQNFINNVKISKFEYPILILLSILGMFFMVSANDLILFYLGLELQSLALYILASINRSDLRSTESGIKYFVLSALSSGLLLYGCSLLYGFTGSTNYEIIQTQIADNNIGALFATVFIIVGLAFKVSAVPFHMWTPDVYEGSPTSVTNFFAVVPKIAGIAVIIRFMDVPFKMILSEWQLIVIFLSIASMILGAVAAIGQTNIKRLLAYSSIGHIGYILAGISTGEINGYSSSIIYLTIYVVMNIGT